MQGTLGNPIKCSSQCKRFMSYNLLLDILKIISDIPLGHLNNLLSSTWEHSASQNTEFGSKCKHFRKSIKVSVNSDSGFFHCWSILKDHSELLDQSVGIGFISPFFSLHVRWPHTISTISAASECIVVRSYSLKGFCFPPPPFGLLNFPLLCSVFKDGWWGVRLI